MLLNLQIGSAMLLRDSVEKSSLGVGAEAVLNEMGIYLIKAKDASTLLTHRIEYNDMANY